MGGASAGQRLGASSRADDALSTRPLGRPYNYNPVAGLSTCTPETRGRPIILSRPVVYACFSAAVFLAQSLPPSLALNRFSAVSSTFLSPPAPQTLHRPLSSDTASRALSALFFSVPSPYISTPSPIPPCHLQRLPVDCSSPWRSTTITKVTTLGTPIPAYEPLMPAKKRRKPCN
jgi:hypothetical protein